MRSTDKASFALASATAVAPGHALASDFYSLIVVFVAFGIAVLLVVQSLIGVVLVIDRRYTTRKPALFVGIAVALLAIGSLMVLDESAHLNAEDLLVCFLAMFIPGAAAIVPPLLQYRRSKS